MTDEETTQPEAFESFKMAVCMSGDPRGSPFYEDLVMKKLQPLLDRQKHNFNGKPRHDLLDFLFRGVEVLTVPNPREGLCDACGVTEVLTHEVRSLCSEMNIRVMSVGPGCMETLFGALDVLECLHKVRCEIDEIVWQRFRLFQEESERC